MDIQITQLGLLEDEDVLLDSAALALAGVDHPGTDLVPYEELIDAIAMRLADVGVQAESGAARAARRAQVLAEEFGFAGDRDSYDDPDNADLIRVIDRRRGLPVSLSILYIAVGRRLGWTVDALDVPGHLLVLVGDEATPVIVDPFRGGVVVDAESLAALVASSNDGTNPAVRQISTMSNRVILVRLLLNQATRAEAAGKGRRALILYERMTAFAPDFVDAWWHRARLELMDGDVEAGRKSLSAVLEITRDAEVREKVSNMLNALAAA
jgi:regulator of sirC expression with transglutaminase-like and TPR domain